MGIACENRNFHGSETDSTERKKMSAGKEIGGGGGLQKKKHRFYFFTKYPQNTQSTFTRSYRPS